MAEAAELGRERRGITEPAGRRDFQHGDAADAEPPFDLVKEQDGHVAGGVWALPLRREHRRSVRIAGGARLVFVLEL